MNLFDLHCDTLYECCETGKHIRENNLHINFESAKRYIHYVQFFALFCGAQPPETIKEPRDSLLAIPEEKRLDRMLKIAESEFALNQDWLAFCVSASDLEKAISENKAASFLSIEGAELLPTQEHVFKAYEAGVRMIALSWNYRNKYACGAVCDNKEGLSQEGKNLVKTLEGLGIIIDVSHLSEKGFWDLCNLTDAPFIASHSNSRAVCRHLRNLTDEQFSEIAKRGGLAGINLYSPFLSWQNRVEVDDVIRHIEHFFSLGGEKSLALGADFDGCDKLPNGISGLGDLYKLADRMLQLGFSEYTINGLFYENAFNFIKKIL